MIGDFSTLGVAGQTQKNPAYGSREILIFEGAICSLWNHSFYSSFCQTVFKTVFVFKIGRILVCMQKKNCFCFQDWTYFSMYAIQNNHLFLGLYTSVDKCTSPLSEHVPRVDDLCMQSRTTPCF